MASHAACSMSMQAWKILRHSPELKLTQISRPFISSPNDVLIKVHASSINKLDCDMRHGYGSTAFDLVDYFSNSTPRITSDRYPLTLGRDFSGVVTDVGPTVKDIFVGQEVFGSVDPFFEGSHAEYVKVPRYSIAEKPKSLSHVEAASVPYAALTAYSGLTFFGLRSPKVFENTSALVLGASGGVGTYASQLLRYYGARVVGTCSESKLKLLQTKPYIDDALDHNDEAQMDTLNGQFDIVIDCGKHEKDEPRQHAIQRSFKFLKPRNSTNFRSYVTFTTPVIKNFDNHGLLLGAAKSVADLLADVATGIHDLHVPQWSFYQPNRKALEDIGRFLEEDSMRSVVWKVYDFEDMPLAYEELESGRVFGKVVVDLMKTSTHIKQKN